MAVHLTALTVLTLLTVLTVLTSLTVLTELTVLTVLTMLIVLISPRLPTSRPDLKNPQPATLPPLPNHPNTIPAPTSHHPYPSQPSPSAISRPYHISQPSCRLRWDAFSELSFDQEHISAMRQSMRDDIEKLGQEQMKLAHCAAVATAAERRRSKAVSSQCVE